MKDKQWCDLVESLNKRIVELEKMLNRAETQCEERDNVLRAMTSESEPSEIRRLRALVGALETDWINAQGKLPLISRARAESATGTQWCNGQEFTADEKEDITRYIIYGATIQQSKDGEVIIPLQAQLERIVGPIRDEVHMVRAGLYLWKDSLEGEVLKAICDLVEQEKPPHKCPTCGCTIGEYSKWWIPPRPYGKV